MSPRRLNDRILFGVNDIARHTPWLHKPVYDYATYGVALFALLLLVGLVVARRSPSRRLAAAGWAPLGMLLAVGLNQPLGRFVGEARPYDTHPQLLVLATRTTDFSFPSDHSVMAGAVAAGLFLVSRKLGWTALIAALVMAFARVYIAAHYPWDVASGLCVGAIVSLVGWLVLRPVLVRLTVGLRRLPLIRAAFRESPELVRQAGGRHRRVRGAADRSSAADTAA